MESVELKSTTNASTITFFDRQPQDLSLVLASFAVRLRDTNLDAVARVDAYMIGNLAEFFAEIAEDWQTFKGPKGWSSLEGEFSLEVEHDGLGHFTVFADLQSGWDRSSWAVRTSIVAETAQLDQIAAGVREFMGKHA